MTNSSGQTNHAIPEWTAGTHRLAPLVDGVEYYRFVRDAMIRARRQIMIVGWELHSEVELIRGDDTEGSTLGGWPVRLGELLIALVEARPELHVNLLIWEGQTMFAFERQHFPRMKRPWSKHPRIRLVWDSDTPPYASQHQKFVVIDDCVALSGGMDLTTSRWDTHDHDPHDPRRRNPGIVPTTGYPYHDMMIAVDGEAARVIGSWARERWRLATEEVLQPPESNFLQASDPWPPELTPLLENKTVSIALTQPYHGGKLEKRQVEALYPVQIARAKDLIYIENQYFSCGQIADALCERLRDEDGPEVIFILPFGCPGTPQAMGMDPRRDELLDRLRGADPGGRLGVYWATLNGGATERVYDESVYIHAKMMIIDDNLLRIGSANLANRSMGLDTELDITVEVDDATDKVAIAGFRRLLLSYFLDTTADSIASIEASMTPLQAIERIRGGKKTLHPFDHRAGDFEHGLRIPIDLCDPSEPLDKIELERLAEIYPDEPKRRERVANWFRSKLGLRLPRSDG